MNNLDIDRLLIPKVESLFIKTEKQEKKATKGNFTFGDDPEEFLDYVNTLGIKYSLTELKDGIKFDCKHIPEEFIYQTGADCLLELEDGKECPKLPFTNCVFEFKNSIVHAIELNDGDKEELGEASMVFHSYVYPITDKVIVKNITGRLVWTKDAFVDHYGDDEGFEVIDTEFIEDDETDQMGQYGGRMLLGLLVLFEERLLKERKIKGASLTKNARNRDKGQPVMSPYRIVTLNLAETRRQAKATKLRSHESPMLHWRRGHWRTLHRGSEFEQRTWIKRCLVGDPDKGFVSKHYRAIYQQTIH